MKIVVSSAYVVVGVRIGAPENVFSIKVKGLAFEDRVSREVLVDTPEAIVVNQGRTLQDDDERVWMKRVRLLTPVERAFKQAEEIELRG